MVAERRTVMIHRHRAENRDPNIYDFMRWCKRRRTATHTHSTNKTLFGFSVSIMNDTSMATNYGKHLPNFRTLHVVKHSSYYVTTPVKVCSSVKTASSNTSPDHSSSEHTQVGCLGIFWLSSKIEVGTEL